MAMSTQKSAEKMRRNMTAQNWLDGVDGLTETPGVRAAEAANDYAAGTAEAVSSGRYREGQLSYTLTEYKDRAREKAGSYSGAAARAVANWMSVENSGLAAERNAIATETRARPGASLAERIAASGEFQSRMATLAGKYRRRGRSR